MTNGEELKGNTEISKDGWSGLKELPRDGYVDSGMNKVVEKETPEERQRKVFYAKAKVRESYKKGNAKKPASIGAGTIKNNSSSQEHLSSSTATRKLSRYDMAERPRVDRIKSDLENFLSTNIGEYEKTELPLGQALLRKWPD